MNVISVIIPAKNEQDNILRTIEEIRRAFDRHGFSFEIIVVNDGSTDKTAETVEQIAGKDFRIRLAVNKPPFGFGNAIKKGLDVFRGNYAIVAMADSSDDPEDMVRYVEKLQEGYDCCFGARWVKGSDVQGYPKIKYILNRIFNWGVSLLFGLHYQDVTNAFKAYSRKAIEGIKPVLSRHFNITVELPLKAIVRGYSYTVIPVNWKERRIGRTGFKLQEMGSRYMFIILYVLLEKLLCGSDYKKQ